MAERNLYGHVFMLMQEPSQPFYRSIVIYFEFLAYFSTLNWGITEQKKAIQAKMKKCLKW